jgi:hypothetical protein
MAMRANTVLARHRLRCSGGTLAPGFPGLDDSGFSVVFSSRTIVLELVPVEEPPWLVKVVGWQVVSWRGVSSA